jgi:eukaryotic-like serine/threonine-protein kinase
LENSCLPPPRLFDLHCLALSKFVKIAPTLGSFLLHCTGCRFGGFLVIGKTLGHYQITNQLGKGGMGEVFQAKDQVLGREVAIKVLPDEFAKDADRVARFQREAKVLASLNHSNIAAIHGLEQSEGKNFLVLELVEGETLAERLKRGPIPVEESLKLALQIAEALEAAHEKGVIHRDLKPANIKVTPDGMVKVLDFGLAKAYAGDQEVNLSNSPTLSDAATRQGVILGTAAYMSPEQARGKPVDKRTDIWAFGCVLYEMLTGQAAFQGEDVTEILAAVVKGGADLDLLPANIHYRVREVIIRCLQKDLKKRYSGIADAKYEIEQALADPSGVLVQPIAAVKPRAKLGTILPWAAAALALGLIIAGVVVWKLKPSEPRQVQRYDYHLPEGQQFGSLYDFAISISPDGRQIVYATKAGLYLRSTDAFDARLIAGTEGNPQRPFFSPDGKWIGYWSESEKRLKKVPVSGGAPVTIGDAVSIGSFDWGADGTIVYGQREKGIMHVSANGGTPEVIIAPGKEALAVLHPQILPDGKSVLYTKLSSGVFGEAVVGSLQSGKSKNLFPGNAARYLPTGHIVYELENNLLAIPFDLKTLSVTGGPVPVIENVIRMGGAPQYAVSGSGTLVYIPGTKATAEPGQRTLVWVDKRGREEPITAPPNDYRFPRMSPDGTKVALAINAGDKSDIWIWDLLRETMMRLTLNEASNCPLWTPDGKRIVFSVSGDRRAEKLYWKAADGTGSDEALGSVKGKMYFTPSSWSADGKTLVAYGRDVALDASHDIGVMSMDGDHQWKPLLDEKYNEVNAEISPDGRWMAYGSNESGRNEVYVRPFPGANTGKWPVSMKGGFCPLWSPDGRTLYYRADDAVMAVPVETLPAFKPGKPEILFRGTYVGPYGGDAHLWDISPDGKRFLMMKAVQSTEKAPAVEPPRRINIVLNWTEELKQRVPVK